MKTQETKTVYQTIFDNSSPEAQIRLQELMRITKIDENDALLIVLEILFARISKNLQNNTDLVNNCINVTKNEIEKCVQACTNLAKTVSIDHEDLVYNAQNIREMLDEKLDPILAQLSNIDAEQSRLGERMNNL